MLKRIKTICLIFSVVLLASCGFQFHNGLLIPKELQTLKLESSDPYSDMTVALRRQLQLNNIKVVDSGNVPVLRINQVSNQNVVASVFKQGREAEKMLMLNVDVAVKFSEKETHRFPVKVNRAFFDNSRAALAKAAEKEIILKDMHEQAARAIISKLVSLQTEVK